jgi:hypothetical protein
MSDNYTTEADREDLTRIAVTLEELMAEVERLKCENDGYDYTLEDQQRRIEELEDKILKEYSKNVKRTNQEVMATKEQLEEWAIAVENFRSYAIWPEEAESYRDLAAYLREQAEQVASAQREIDYDNQD